MPQKAILPCIQHTFYIWGHPLQYRTYQPEQDHCFPFMHICLEQRFWRVCYYSHTWLYTCIKACYKCTFMQECIQASMGDLHLIPDPRQVVCVSYDGIGSRRGWSVRPWHVILLLQYLFPLNWSWLSLLLAETTTEYPTTSSCPTSCDCSADTTVLCNGDEADPFITTL